MAVCASLSYLEVLNLKMTSVLIFNDVRMNLRYIWVVNLKITLVLIAKVV